MSSARPPERCACCGTAKGNKSKGWQPVVRGDDAVTGYTCPDCPTHREPIRRRVTSNGSVRWRAVVDATRPGATSRKQVTRNFADLQDARAFVEQTRAQVTAGTYRPGKPLTVRELADLWLADKQADSEAPGGIREVTVNGYRSSLHAALGHVGDRQAAEVTPADVRALLRTLATVGGKWQRGLSHRSVCYALGSLRQVYAFGVENGHVIHNPAATVKPPKEQHTADSKRTDRQRWSPAEVAAFRTHIDSYGDGELFAAEPWLRAAMRLTLCGLRRSEVLGLDWRAVDLTTGAVRVEQGRVKTGRGTATAIGPVKAANSLRTVEAEQIHDGTRAALRDLWLVQGKPTEGLVALDVLARPVDPDAYSARFRALCIAAGVPALTSIHNLRHSLATAMKAADVPDHEAASLLGHDVATYRRFYLVTDDEGAASAARAAGSIFRAV